MSASCIGPTIAHPAPAIPSPGAPAFPTLTSAQQLPAASLLPPIPAPPAPSTAPSTVRVSGLQSSNQEAMTAALTSTLGTPVYVTSQDSRRRWGIAVVPPSVHASLFLAHHKRLLQHPDGWELTLTCRNETTGEPWRTRVSSLTDPPPQRPHSSHISKRFRVDPTPPSRHRRSPRLQEQAQHVQQGSRAGRAVRKSPWSGRQERC